MVRIRGRVNQLEKSIWYFEKPGVQNTGKTLELARRRAEELKIKQIVVASTWGDTGLKALETFDDLGVHLVVVTICKGFEDEGWVMEEKTRRELEGKGARVLTCLHALEDNVSSAFTEKFGGKTHSGVVAEVLRRFCQGMKVAVEITLMAADAGLIDVRRDVLAIAGTDRGADTAIVVKPAYPRKFLELRIKEIVAKPT